MVKFKFCPVGLYDLIGKMPGLKLWEYELKDHWMLSLYIYSVHQMAVECQNNLEYCDQKLEEKLVLKWLIKMLHQKKKKWTSICILLTCCINSTNSLDSLFQTVN